MAVAAASPLGFGSDSGGSIRLPAAWCGVYGFKPTTGRIPGTGHFPRVGERSDGRTQIGPLARSIDDLELALAVIAGPDGRDAGVPPVALTSSRDVQLSDLRFTVVTSGDGWNAAEAIVTAVAEAADTLEAAGCRRVDWTAPWLGDALDITRGYWGRARLSGAETAQQLWEWDRFRRKYLEASEQVDLILTPVTRETAPRHREVIGDDFVFTLPASLTGSPAVSVPMGLDPDGLPLAVQVVGRPWEDHRVLAAARAVGAVHP